MRWICEFVGFVCFLGCLFGFGFVCLVVCLFGFEMGFIGCFPLLEFDVFLIWLVVCSLACVCLFFCLLVCLFMFVPPSQIKVLLPTFKPSC